MPPPKILMEAFNVWTSLPAVAPEIGLTILAAVIGDGESRVLGTQWRTLPDILSADDVVTLQSMWQDSLREVAREVAP